MKVLKKNLVEQFSMYERIANSPIKLVSKTKISSTVVH